MKIKIKNNIIGLNLVSLIIGSALGAFLLTVIVKISISINNNQQFIKANLELTISARQLTNFFSQVFMANGYIEPTASSSSAANKNIFVVDTSNGETRFYLWYSAGIGNALSCSGQPLAVNSSNPATFLRIALRGSQYSVSSGGGSRQLINGDPYTKCNDATLAGGSNLPPIVSPQQFQNFYLVATANSSSSANLVNILIDPTIMNSSLQTYGNARGIKLAIILRSAKPVFNTTKTASFTVFQKTFSFTDKYLYKLVIIQAPFFYTVNSTVNTSSNSLTTQQCAFATNTPTPCIYSGAPNASNM